MKTKATMLAIMALLFCVPAKSADLYVNNSGQSGTYTTIQTALNVASSGDRIFVSPYGIYSEDLTISKSITIAPSIEGSNIVLNGKITFWPFANDIINIIGINASNCDLTTNTISATVNTKATINITSCTFSTDIDLDHDAILVNTYFSTFRHLYLTYGNSIANKGTSIRYFDGPNTVLGDTSKVLANLIGSSITYGNNDFYYRISNNRCNSINIQKPVFNSNVNNFITNNWVNDDRINTYSIEFLFFTAGDNYSNVMVSGNVVHTIHNDSDPNGEETQIIRLWKNLSTPAVNLSQTNSPVVFYNINLASTHRNDRSPNTAVYRFKYSGSGSGGFSGSLNEGYNTRFIERNTSMNGYLDYSGSIYIFKSLSPADKSKVADLEYFVDLNAPTTEYYDIDLTRGDLGPWGGPYSWDNYWDSATGNARIIDINLPSEIWPGQTVNLKAEAVHTN